MHATAKTKKENIRIGVIWLLVDLGARCDWDFLPLTHLKLGDFPHLGNCLDWPKPPKNPVTNVPKTHWPSKIAPQETQTYGIAAWLQSGMATRMMIENLHNLDSIQHRYLNLLAVPGTVIWHKDLGEAKTNMWYVLAAKLHGVVAVKLYSFKKKGETLICKLDDLGHIMHNILYIRTAMGWRSIPCRASPPCLRADSNGLLVEVVGKGVPLLELAAQHAFAGMTSIQLQQLWALLDVDGVGDKAPALLKDLLTGLLRHCLPKASDAQITKLLNDRSLAPKSTPFENILPANADVIMEDMDLQDATELMSHVEQHQKVRASETSRDRPVGR